MTAYAKAAKSYSMKKCECCNGEGRGVSANGNRWICTNCDGAGKVSIYPPKLNVWIGFGERL